MKPVIFEKDATDFTTVGIARLPDAVSCKVTEERNGAFELEMEYPATGRHFEEIVEDRIIAAVSCDGGTKQGFRIYRITTPINGLVTVYARHVSYQLNLIPVTPVSGSGTAQQAMAAMKAAAQETCPFTFTSNITGSKSYAIAQPMSLRSMLGGVEGSILDTYGGEYEWDNFTVNLKSARGSDNGVRIVYGKNLTSITRSVDMESTITGVMCYWAGQDEKGNDTIVYSSPKVISNANVGDYAFHRTAVLDISGEFDDKPTTAQVTSYATSYLASTAYKEVVESVNVEFVALWQSPEYKDYAPLERVGLCDTVYVSYKQLGISVKKKVTKTVYNVLLDRYDSVELGGETSLSDTITAMETDTDKIASRLASLFSKEVTRSIKTYNAVTQLGLSAGSATIAAAYSAMPNASILITRGDTNFSASELPRDGVGTVVIIKRVAGRGCVMFLGKRAQDADWRMYLNGSDAPDGTWVSDNQNDFTNNSAVDLSGYSSSGNMYTIPVDGYVYISNNSGQTGRGMIYGSAGTSTYIQIGNAQGRYSTFVRRGMKTYLDGTSAFYRFVPLS